MRPVARSLPFFVVAAFLVLPGRALAGDVTVQLTAPAAGTPVHRTVAVTATAPGADSVAFQLATGSGGPYSDIGTDSDGSNGWKVPWDTTTGTDGSRFLRARADAGTEQFFSAPVQVTVDNTAPVVAVAASPSPFSPNGDQVRDRTVVTVTLSETAALELDVVKPGVAVVKRLASGARFGAGAHRFEWRGMVRSGGHWRRAGDGTYAVRGTAVDPAGNPRAGAGSVRVDTRPPGFLWHAVSPEPAFGSGPITLSFRTSDPAPRVTVAAEIWNDFKRILITDRVSKPTGAASVRLTLASSPLPGLYRARLLLIDQAGNRTLAGFLPFRVQHPVKTTVVRGFTGVGRRVALTFDDCIFGDAWDSILDTLEANHVHATFFCASVNLVNNVRQARRALAAGMSIGSHTRDHPDLRTLSYSQIRAQIQADIDTWWHIARATPLPFFRPPYGAYDDTVLRAAGDLGFARTMLWDVDPQDWSDPGVSEIQRRVLSHAHPGMVVVMHVKPQTASALPGLLHALAARDLHQVGLDEMFRVANGTTDLRLGPAEWGRHRAG
ncbi:MAG: polysaccharide deacetylase family protein [Actinomycetota bacterium]